MTRVAYTATASNGVITVSQQSLYAHEITAAQSNSCALGSGGCTVVSNNPNVATVSQGTDATNQVAVLMQQPGPCQLTFSAAGCPNVVIECDLG